MPTLTVYGTGVWPGPTMWDGEPVRLLLRAALRESFHEIQ